jgi:hypothetical protein
VASCRHKKFKATTTTTTTTTTATRLIHRGIWALCWCSGSFETKTSTNIIIYYIYTSYNNPTLSGH